MQPSGSHSSLTLSPQSPVRAGLSPNKLRYEAYAAPQAVPSLRHLLNPHRTESTLSSPGSRTRSSSRGSDRGMSLAEFARTFTPGELAIFAAESPLHDLREVRTI